MGIKGFHHATKHLLQCDVPLSHFAGKVVAVDASSWMYKSTVGHARSLLLGELETMPWCEYSVAMINLLRSSGITPLVVFDGHRHTLKENTCVIRHTKKAEAMKEAMIMETLGDRQSAEKMWMQAFFVTKQMERDVIHILDQINVRYVVAEQEADQEIGRLCQSGVAYAAISEDSDLFGYGVDRMLFKMKLQDGSFEYLDCMRPLPSGENLPTSNKRRPIITLHDLSRTQRALIATFSGNDYVSNPKNFGVKKIYTLAKRSTTFDNMVENMSLVVDLDSDYVAAAQKVFELYMLGEGALI